MTRPSSARRELPARCAEPCADRPQGSACRADITSWPRLTCPARQPQHRLLHPCTRALWHTRCCWPGLRLPCTLPAITVLAVQPWLLDCLFPCRATFDPDTIRSRLRELAFLNSRATIFFRAVDGKQTATSANGSSSGSSNSSNGGSSGTGEAAADASAAATLSPAAAEAAAAGWEVFHYSGGLAEYVRYLNRDKEAIHEPFFFSKQVGLAHEHLSRQARAVVCGVWPMHVPLVGLPAMTGAEASQGLLNPGRSAVPPTSNQSSCPLPACLQADGYTVEVALQWCSDAFRSVNSWGRCPPCSPASPCRPRRLTCRCAKPLRLPRAPLFLRPTPSQLPVFGLTPPVSGLTLPVFGLTPPPSRSDTIIGFVNSIKTIDGGTHIDGTKAALTRTGEAACPAAHGHQHLGPCRTGAARSGCNAVPPVQLVPERTRAACSQPRRLPAWLPAARPPKTAPPLHTALLLPREEVQPA